MSAIGRLVVAITSSLASLAALGCALESRLLPGTLCVVVGVALAARLWVDDRRRER